jgi:hypothetical protein
MRYINAITRNENKGEYIASDILLGGLEWKIERKN